MEQQCFRPGGLDFTQKLINMANLQKGIKILDAGCGGGLTVRWLGEQGYDSWGIDKLKAEGINQAVCGQIVCGDLHQLPFADQTFAAVISECTFSLCGDPVQVLGEWKRVLEVQGKLLLADVYFHGDLLPNISNKRPLTMKQWRELLLQGGFEIFAEEDVSASWKPFLLEQLWAGRAMEEIWGGCCPDDSKIADRKRKRNYQAGYFLICAEKQ